MPKNYWHEHDGLGRKSCVSIKSPWIKPLKLIKFCHRYSLFWICHWPGYSLHENCHFSKNVSAKQIFFWFRFRADNSVNLKGSNRQTKKSKHIVRLMLPLTLFQRVLRKRQNRAWLTIGFFCEHQRKQKQNCKQKLNQHDWHKNAKKPQLLWYLDGCAMMIRLVSDSCLHSEYLKCRFKVLIR